MPKSVRGVSPALVISIVALVLAATGTSLASASAVIAKALGLSSTQRSQVKSIADKEISSGAAGVSVSYSASAGSASRATSATGAASATGATNAVNATNATTAATASNALGLGGIPASGFTRSDCESTTGRVARGAHFGEGEGGSRLVPLAPFVPLAPAGPFGRILPPRADAAGGRVLRRAAARVPSRSRTSARRRRRRS